MEDVAEQVREAGRRALPVAMDLRDAASIEAAAEAADAEFGRVDVLVNNSGVGGPSAPVVKMRSMSGRTPSVST
jgi:NAD(P)-dependent dehydrogenase (short-subunit alcohol dehydrogenase family)